MEIVLTGHARRRMSRRNLTIEQILMVISTPDAMRHGRLADLYDRVIDDGRLIRVVVVPSTQPAVIITVMIREKARIEGSDAPRL